MSAYDYLLYKERAKKGPEHPLWHGSKEATDVGCPLISERAGPFCQPGDEYMSSNYDSHVMRSILISVTRYAYYSVLIIEELGALLRQASLYGEEKA